LQEIIAVFPLPKVVAFPGQVFPLHIFEPRYRKMVEWCLENGKRMGICPPQKTLKITPKKESIKKAFNSNHNLYLPQNILSAGEIQVTKVLPDGRFLLNLLVKKRMEVLEWVQNIPFYLASARELPTLTRDHNLSKELFDKLLNVLFQLFGEEQNCILEQFLKTYQINDLETLLLRFFEIGVLPSTILQKCLKIDYIEERAQLVIEVLNTLKGNTLNSKNTKISDGGLEKLAKVLPFSQPNFQN
jgi:Lon protease-like protein